MLNNLHQHENEIFTCPDTFNPHHQMTSIEKKSDTISHLFQFTQLLYFATRKAHGPEIHRHKFGFPNETFC